MQTRERLVVLGSGFGAFSLLKGLRARDFDVTLVSPRNHFLFTPLLPSTTVGTIEFRSIIESVRTAHPATRFYLAEATGVDLARRCVICAGSLDGRVFELPFDRLVIAVGSQSNTFGIPGVEEHALFLKELSDARALRQRVLACFESANTPGISPVERARLLHMVIVGGGPTGVEFAAELNDFLHDVRKWFADIGDDVRITLIEASSEILLVFDKRLRAYAAKRFKRQRIALRTDQRVQAVHADHLVLASGERVDFGLLLWSTGIGPRPFVRSLALSKDPRGQLLTDAFLRVQGQDRVYAIGDCANVEGKSYPATAQVAQREGAYLAASLRRLAHGREAAPFQYRNMGMLAYIGGRRALADLPQVGIHGAGLDAWVFWRSAYVTKLVSLKNKILVVFDWLKAAIFGRDISRF